MKVQAFLECEGLATNFTSKLFSVHKDVIFSEDRVYSRESFYRDDAL